MPITLWGKDMNEPVNVASVLAIFLPFTVGCGLLLTDAVAASNNTWTAKRRIETVSQHMGRAPVIADEVQRATKSVATATENLDFLKTIRKSQTNQDVVVAYLTAARSLGVDDTFVSNNGMVRDQDRDLLYRAALASGNNTAQAQAAMTHYKALANR